MASFGARYCFSISPKRPSKGALKLSELYSPINELNDVLRGTLEGAISQPAAIKKNHTKCSGSLLG